MHLEYVYNATFKNMDYRREIDGLRAIALIPVVLFHAGFATFSGGYVGVDIFFVISGYLITSIILNELAKGTFSLIDFYERRARRILPALFVVILICVPFAWLWMIPSEFKSFSRSLSAVSVFASNFLFWKESGYFNTTAELKPLLHTWSLSVEEQYYVIFPILLMMFWKLGRRSILAVLGAIFIVSLALAQWGVINKPDAAFYLLPTRMWELLIGAFAAFFLSKENKEIGSRSIAESASWFGLLLILYSVFAFDRSTPFPGLYALLPTTGTLLIILFATETTMAGKLIGNRIFVGIGCISYSAYLWHQPLFALPKIYTFNQLNSTITAALIFLSFLLAYLSYRYIETPFRAKQKISRRGIFTFSAAGLLFFFSIGLAGNISNGFPGKLSHVNEAIGDWQHPGILKKTSIDGYYKSDNSKPIDILVFGDSHAEQLAPLSQNIVAAGKNVGFLSGGGCPPIPNLLEDLHPHCFDLFNKLSKVLSAETHTVQVIIAGCFNCYFIGQSQAKPDPGDHYNYYYLHEGKKLFFRSGLGQSESIGSFKLFLEGLSSRYKLVVIGDNPMSDNFNPAVILSHVLRGESIHFKTRYPNFTKNEFQVSNQEIEVERQLRLATPPDVKYISLIDIICPKSICATTDGSGQPLYKDANHIRPAFAQTLIGPYLMESTR